MEFDHNEDNDGVPNFEEQKLEIDNTESLTMDIVFLTIFGNSERQGINWSKQRRCISPTHRYIRGRVLDNVVVNENLSFCTNQILTFDWHHSHFFIVSYIAPRFPCIADRWCNATEMTSREVHGSSLLS